MTLMKVLQADPTQAPQPSAINVKKVAQIAPKEFGLNPAMSSLASPKVQNPSTSQFQNSALQSNTRDPASQQKTPLAAQALTTSSKP